MNVGQYSLVYVLKLFWIGVNGANYQPPTKTGSDFKFSDLIHLQFIPH